MSGRWEFFRFSYSNVCMTLESDLLVFGGYEERVDYLCGLFGVIATQVVAWNGLLVWLYACSTRDGVFEYFLVNVLTWFLFLLL